MNSELDYAKAYLESRFPTNSHQRLEMRDTGPELIPFFVLARTRLGCIWRFREDLIGATIGELSKLAGREGPLSLSPDDAPPPERMEPMARVLRDAGMQVEPARDLLVHRAGWAPTGASVLFRVETPSDLSELAQTLPRAQMGSSSWKQRAAFSPLDAREWIRFADLIRFVAA